MLLRWGVQQGHAVPPRSANHERVRQNADLFGLRLDDDDVAASAKMDRGDGIAWSQGEPLQSP